MIYNLKPYWRRNVPGKLAVVVYHCTTYHCTVHTPLRLVRGTCLRPGNYRVSYLRQSEKFEGLCVVPDKFISPLFFGFIVLHYYIAGQWPILSVNEKHNAGIPGSRQCRQCRRAEELLLLRRFARPVLGVPIRKRVCALPRLYFTRQYVGEACWAVIGGYRTRPRSIVTTVQRGATETTSDEDSHNRTADIHSGVGWQQS